VVRAIGAAGHEIASHGWDHCRITKQTPDQFREDVRRTKGLLEEIAGVEVIGYRAPNYSIVEQTLWALDIVLEEGHRYDSSIFPIRHDRYGIPGARRFPWIIRSADGAELVEFPISTVRVAGMILPFVGGGYLRHFPLWFARWGMRRLNQREGQPAMVYIHPWEVDPGQPRQPVDRLTALRHYRNLERTEDRLERLLREFRFASVREVLGL
jgi:polysaccharide deacetylase family protein (PEP-CTERM system associated)